MPSYANRSQQNRNPAQHTDDLFTICQYRETEEDTAVQKKGMALPKQQLAESQEKVGQLVKEKMVKQTKYLLGLGCHLKVCTQYEIACLDCRMKHVRNPLCVVT